MFFGNNVAGEGGTMDAVTAGAAADENDAVAGAGGTFAARSRGKSPTSSAEDQRVAKITLVKIDRAIDGGDAHAVAIIAHAGDNALAVRWG